MSTESHNLLEQALALPESDRAAIAASLFHSLDAGFDDLPFSNHGSLTLISHAR